MTPPLVLVRVTEFADQPGTVVFRLDEPVVTSFEAEVSFTDTAAVGADPTLTEETRQAIINMLAAGLTEVAVISQHELRLTGASTWDTIQVTDTGDAALELAAGTSEHFHETWGDPRTD
jgi:hypothetical protein